MNRNTELHFSQTPQIDIKRSKFEESFSHKLTLNGSEVVPIFCDSDILPGDTVQMDMSELIRMATPIYPIMDNLYADIYWFFVPHRLVWEHWAQFWGENDDPWTQTTPYEIPQINAPTGGWTEGTIADYMGIPTKIDGFSVNALPFRAYCKIWNDWFRSEALKSCAHIYEDETTRNGMTGAETGYTYVTGAEFGGKPLTVAKFHDYFTSALPQPQKGDPVQIPLTGQLEVYAGQSAHKNVGDTAYSQQYAFLDSTGKVANLAANSDGALALNLSSTSYNKKYTGKAGTQNFDVTGATGATPINLYADMSSATAVTVNQLRTAFAIQKYFENAGLHGKKMCRG